MLLQLLTALKIRQLCFLDLVWVWFLTVTGASFSSPVRLYASKGHGHANCSRPAAKPSFQLHTRFLEGAVAVSTDGQHRNCQSLGHGCWERSVNIGIHICRPLGTWNSGTSWFSHALQTSSSFMPILADSRPLPTSTAMLLTELVALVAGGLACGDSASV